MAHQSSKCSRSEQATGGALTEDDERDAVEAGAHVGKAPQQHAELQRVHQVLHQEQPATHARSTVVASPGRQTCLVSSH